MAKNEGKVFEEDLKKSASEQGTFIYRIKDVPPIMLKANANTSKNDFDSFIYKKPNLFPIELKSTKGTSISFSESIIKKHQISALDEASKYDGIIAGFLFQFREHDNFTAFVRIQDFLEYKYIAENQIKPNKYKTKKLNKSSIPIEIVKEIGIELHNVKKKVRHRYYINDLLKQLIDRYGD